MLKFIEEGKLCTNCVRIVCSSNRSYLKWVCKFSSGGPALYTHLGGNYTPSGVSILNQHHKLSSSIIFLHFHLHHFILCSYTCFHSVLPFCFVLFFHFIIQPCFISLFPSIKFRNASSLSPYIDFSFTFGSEPSHLLNLNHLVKLVSSEDLP